jgi:hypothetical protein
MWTRIGHENNCTAWTQWLETDWRHSNVLFETIQHTHEHAMDDPSEFAEEVL